MNTTKRMILALLLALLLALPVLGQDATAEPIPVATAEATQPVESGGVVINVDAGNDTANDIGASDDPVITLKWWQVIAGLFTAAAGGGLIGIAGFGVLATRIRNDTATMSAIEGLAKSVPADVVKVILDTTKSTQAIAGVIEEAFDGIPVASKSAQPGGVSATG